MIGSRGKECKDSEPVYFSDFCIRRAKSLLLKNSARSQNARKLSYGLDRTVVCRRQRVAHSPWFWSKLISESSLYNYAPSWPPAKSDKCQLSRCQFLEYERQEALFLSGE